jgi:hypothetical protein
MNAQALDRGGIHLRGGRRPQPRSNLLWRWLMVPTCAEQYWDDHQC